MRILDKKNEGSFFAVQLLPYKEFFVLKSKFFIAVQGVLDYKYKTVGKCYQY